mmetsp:Transcript_16144/g.46163  ORF Transcript_16144/g.46163 Transcript_16144/m.46163 type:complete len:200 (-) Transcript_16144:1008-1607(-)
MGSTAHSAPSAAFSQSWSSPPSSPPLSADSGAQERRKKLRGSTVGSVRRAAVEKGDRHMGQAGPGGCGMRGSRRARQTRSRSAVSSWTCSAQSRQQKCTQARKPFSPTKTPGHLWRGSKHTPHSEGSSPTPPHSKASSGGPLCSPHSEMRAFHCASSASRTISMRPLSRHVWIADCMLSMPSLRERQARARRTWPTRRA